MIGAEGARYAGTRARNVGRSREAAAEALDRRHLEAAERMVETLGKMKGAAMKVGQMASFIDTEFLPPEYRELYQEQLAKLRTSAPAMPWDKVRKVLDEEYMGEPLEESQVSRDPIEQFRAWFDEAVRAKLPMVNAMTLATTTASVSSSGPAMTSLCAACA